MSDSSASFDVNNAVSGIGLIFQEMLREQLSVRGFKKNGFAEWIMRDEGAEALETALNQLCDAYFHSQC